MFLRLAKYTHMSTFKDNKSLIDIKELYIY